MNEAFCRTESLIGPERMARLKESRVAVFGIGGVGGYAVEALTRSGIGAIDLVDHDRVAWSNLNRQIIATRRTIGMLKVDAAEERIREINPECIVRKHALFFLPETRAMFDFSEYDYVIDAIDTVTGKLQLIQAAQDTGTPIISCMGAGNKMNPGAFRIADLYETSVCPLARIMRKECRKRGIRGLKVLYSVEEPVRPAKTGEDSGNWGASKTERVEGQKKTHRKDTPGSISFVPSAAGLMIAGEVIRDLIGMT